MPPPPALLEYRRPPPPSKRRPAVTFGQLLRAHCVASYVVGIPGSLFVGLGLFGLLLGIFSPLILPICAFLILVNFRYADHDDDLAVVALVVAVVLYSGTFVLALRHARRQPVPLHLRYPAGRCRACGYDLSQSPGRCPECGTFPYRDHGEVTAEAAADALARMGAEGAE